MGRAALNGLVSSACCARCRSSCSDRSGRTHTAFESRPSPPRRLIEADTLLWHLSATDAEWVRHLFGASPVRPFAMLLAALCGDHDRLGARREAARRRQGLGGAERRAREDAGKRAAETAAARALRERRESQAPAAERFAIGRFIDGRPPSPSRICRARRSTPPLPCMRPLVRTAATMSCRPAARRHC